MSFVQTILLLIPGFVALWVYQESAGDRIRKASDGEKTSLGITLGFVNMLLLSIPAVFFGSPVWPNPMALFAGDSASFGREFWITAGSLFGLAFPLGALCGIISRTRLNAFHLFGRGIGRLDRQTCHTPFETALARIIEEEDLIDPSFSIMRVYGSGKGKCITGVYQGFSGKDLVLDKTYYFKKPTDFPEHPSNVVVVNLESGIVVEIAGKQNLSATEQAEWVEELKQRSEWKPISEGPSAVR